jgi:DNA repair protein RecN (Recombination protein N)
VLVELHVRRLGVIDEVAVELGPGMTALTGETGAGKTLVVEALQLLLGGRADPGLVRPGAAEALVEGRFVLDVEGPGGDEATELILSRSVPAAGGRSRAWVDGKMAPASALAEHGGRLVDLYGQHAQQSLFDPAAQRRALDAFGAVDTTDLRRLQQLRRRLDSELRALGGDERARAREIDLLRHQLDEIDAAGLADPDEDARLAEEEERLAEAVRYRELAGLALDALEPDTFQEPTGAVDRLGQAASALGGRPALQPLAERLRALQAECADVASELRAVRDGWESDPRRLDEVRSRRQLVRDLSRKYGEGIAGILDFAARARGRLEELQSVEGRAARLASELQAAEEALSAEQAVVGAARRRAAPALGTAVEQRLQRLAMEGARFEVAVGDADPADEVTFLLAANRGEAVAPLAKVASGGELARAMLALRLVLSEAPPTMVFDEVDAGVGGRAAVSVGQALAELAPRRQVLVVTHLAQVAAFADRHLVVHKLERGGRTSATVVPVQGDDRVVELARMLSGRPGSATARRHAEELLATAGSGALHR